MLCFYDTVFVGGHCKIIPAGNLPYVWDYDIDAEQFREILDGKRTFGRLNQDWAARRLLEYASYEEIIDLIGFCRLTPRTDGGDRELVPLASIYSLTNPETRF